MIGEFAYNKINFLANKISDPNVEPDKNDLKIIEYIGDNIIKKEAIIAHSQKTKTFYRKYI